jgi:hypothetical protein
MNNIAESNICERLKNGHLSGRTLLSTFRMVEESLRESPLYTDNRYAPFYYILGQEVPSKNVIEFGLGVGIASGCYVRGCSCVEKILSFQQSGKEYYSPRIGTHNVRKYFKERFDVHVGRIYDEEFVFQARSRQWDLAIVNEEVDYGTLMEHLEFAWDVLAIDGTLVVDYVNSNDQVKSSYSDFCKRKAQLLRIIPTKYGVGLLTKTYRV